MARFIRINGALIQVADSTATRVLDQASDANISDFDKVSNFVVTKFSSLSVGSSPTGAATHLVAVNGCDVTKACCWSIAVGSGSSDITSGTLWLYAHGNLNDYAPRALASYNFAVSGALTDGTSLSLPIEPCEGVGSGELISIYASPGLDASFTGAITLDLRRDAR